MVDPELTDPETFYDEYGEREWERLDRDLFHRLEWEGTVAQLEEHLPDPDGSPHVLDAGGGAGRYSIWLARQGYSVTLAELSESQREIAREKAAEAGVVDSITVCAGDIRDLSFDDDAFDATCCLGGPLSHVVDDAERERATAELRRVTAPDGPVFVSVMGRLGFVMMTVQYAGREEDNGGLPLLPALVEDGNLTAERAEAHGVEPIMADCHFFRRAELADLLSTAGLAVESVTALEGVAGIRRTHFEELGDDDRETIRELNDLLRADRTMADLSPHMLAVCRA